MHVPNLIQAWEIEIFEFFPSKRFELIQTMVWDSLILTFFLFISLYSLLFIIHATYKK